MYVVRVDFWDVYGNCVFLERAWQYVIIVIISPRAGPGKNSHNRQQVGSLCICVGSCGLVVGRIRRLNHQRIGRIHSEDGRSFQCFAYRYNECSEPGSGIDLPSFPQLPREIPAFLFAFTHHA